MPQQTTNEMSRDIVAVDPAPPRVSDIISLAEEIFGATVTRITAPGGRSRASMRVQVGDRSVISTWRPRASRRQMEVLLLQEMHAAGAAVPQYLGGRGALLFQSDAGPLRLSAELARIEDDARLQLAGRAFDSLWQMKKAARTSGLLAKLPAVAMSFDWLTGFAAGPDKLAAALTIAAPELDRQALAQSLACLPTTFIKWDARPGNAAVQPDGSVVWFDWEHAGRRRGTEDFAFLLGDEFWPLTAEQGLTAFERSAPNPRKLRTDFLIRFTVLHVIHRLRLIHWQKLRHGWVAADRAQRYDKIGTAPECVVRLCALGRGYAMLDPLCAPLLGWLDGVEEALLLPPERDAPGATNAAIDGKHPD